MLLILAALDDATFRRLLDFSRALELDALCEVHDEEELKRALEGGADIIGVNSRNLKTFRSAWIRWPTWPAAFPVTCCAWRKAALTAARRSANCTAAGYQAFLIGEALMRAEDPGKIAAALAGSGMVFAIHLGFTSLAWHSPVRSQNFPKKNCMHTWIKICGTTCLEDALKSIEAGADALGFIFAPSKRRVTPEQAREIIAALPPQVERIGVFMTAGAQIASIVSEVDLTGIQMHGEEFPPEVYRYLPKARRDGLRKIKTILVQEGFETDLMPMPLRRAW